MSLWHLALNWFVQMCRAVVLGSAVGGNDTIALPFLLIVLSV